MTVAQMTGPGQGEAARAETNRDRVRRLLFVPLGFRWPRAMDAEDGRRRLDMLADELAYLADDDLSVLAGMLRTKGEGNARNFWPDRATFIGFAHLVRPLPLENDPKLRSWFGSVEGPRAAEAGALVETWLYFERQRIPPYTPQARQMVAAQAADNARRLIIHDDRVERGVGVDPAEARWAADYRALDARLRAMVADLREGRAA